MSQKICSHCGLTKSLDKFGIDRRNDDGHKGICRNCRNKYEKQFKIKNPEKNKERLRKRRIYRMENIEKFRKYERDMSKKYHQLYPERYKEIFKKLLDKRKLQVLTHYGGNPPKCACCDESIYEFLTIDHIGGGGNLHRRKTGRMGSSFYQWLIKNNYPEGYRVLCWDCNCSLGIHGYCPHKNDKRMVYKEI